MLICINWLRELVELPNGLSPKDIGDTLTLAGLEVEGIEVQGAHLNNVVVAHVQEVEPHPDADKLRIVTVSDGSEKHRIVCGAPNVEKGMKVPFARVGARLSEDFEIKAATIRGVPSAGMLCSAKELQLSDENAGLLKLPDELEPGTAIADVFARNDTILEIGVTPNRPDALSHLGVARELSALYGTRIKVSNPTCPERGGAVDEKATVQIEDTEGCPRYACRVIDNVSVGPSPAWLVARVEAVGIRSINNVVDVTNYVMMERGIPMHAFDYDTLAKERDRAAITVRRAKRGERLKTLDDEDRVLVESDLVIADSEKAIALAGVMGGANTEVNSSTTSVLLEAAHFSARSVRRTARRVGIHSESSHRFERGCDPNGVRASLDRAASLLAEIAGGVVSRGIIDAYPRKIEPKLVALRPERAADTLGIPHKELEEREVSKRLLALGLEVAGRDGDSVRYRVPTFRPDLTREIDLIEELARTIGYDAIEATLPVRTGIARGMVQSERRRIEERMRVAFEAAGLHEAIHVAFHSPAHAEWFAEPENILRLQNPLGEETSVLRPSLLPGLMKSVAHNLKHGLKDVRLYECASVFSGTNPKGRAAALERPGAATGGDAFAIERPCLAGVMAGERERAGIDQAERDTDVFDLKGCLESAMISLGFSGELAKRVEMVAAKDGIKYLHPRASGSITIDQRRVGVFGELHPDFTAMFDVKVPVYAFEIDARHLAQLAPELAVFKALPKLQNVRRDLALLLDKNMSAHEVIGALQKVERPEAHIEEVRVFDVYEGEKLADDKKSIALAITLRPREKTLTDKEINAVQAALVDVAESELKAQVR